MVNRPRVARNHPNQLSREVVDRVLLLRKKYHLSPIRIVWYMARYHGIEISDASVYRTLCRHGVNRLPRNVGLRKIHSIQIIAGNIIPVILIILSEAMPELAVPTVISATLLITITGWHMKFTIIILAAQIQGYSLNKLQRGRPHIRPPVRRKPDKFVF